MSFPCEDAVVTRLREGMMRFEPLRGVYNILTTPFNDDGSLDEASLRRLTEATIAAGVDGITVLGVAGEAHKLLEEERRRVVAIVMEVNAGRVPIVAGASRDATDTTIAACREAQAAGAAGVMVAPPTFVQPGPGLTQHFAAVAETIDIPIVLQDYPPVNGVTLSPRAMADLVAAVPRITTIKLEDPPTPQRIAQTLALLEGRAAIVGGLGGMYLLDELRRGSSGTMTGFAYPEALIAIWRAWDAGDRARAAEVYYRHLPLLVFEGQPKLGIAIRKEILRRRGLISSAHARRPGATLDDGTAADLTETLAYVRSDE
jgi:4-hydroxy-tetrahydrodipicolinate synthase